LNLLLTTGNLDNVRHIDNLRYKSKIFHTATCKVL